jgi:GYF domain 2
VYNGLKYAIYVSKNDVVIGPFTKKELREAVHSGTVSCDNWAWHKELSEWKPVHALIPVIHVSRCGEEIAEFDDEHDILNGLREGTLLMDDYFWCEGMAEWKQLSTLQVSKGALATTAQKNALKAAGLLFDEFTTKAQVSALFSAHNHAPASAKQLALLKYFGRPVSENLSKKGASELIDAITGDSDNRDRFGDWNDDKLILFADIFADEIAALKKECFAEYNMFRADLGSGASGLPKLSLDHATRIFAYLDAFKPGWTKPRTAILLDHFLPCVESKIHLSPTHS